MCWTPSPPRCRSGRAGQIGQVGSLGVVELQRTGESVEDVL
jgi:hypothetical protein